MLRVRGFTQDDAHIFCTPEQMIDEIDGVIDLATHMAKVFGYDFKAYLATRPEKSIGRRGDVGPGRRTRSSRRSSSKDVDYKLDEGGGAFYGPKIDIKWVDALGREWTGPDDPARLQPAASGSMSTTSARTATSTARS